MKKKTIAFQTFGCKLNFAETSAIARKFTDADWEAVDFRDTADIYVVHSCTVTAHAEKKTRAAIRQAIRRNPNASVAVIGCYSQLKPDELKKTAGVDIVLGNSEKYNLFDIISGKDTIDTMPADDKINTSRHYEPGFSMNDRTRSFFKVQDGCDYFCTYCAIPFARGRSRSATIAETLDVARKIADTEVKEIVLTGVNIGDFGRQHGENFLELLKGLEKIEGIDRIRISSVEPELLNDSIIELVASSARFMPHFHIPLQSGTDRILALMKRKYKREVFEARVNKIKSLMPDACIAADVITGFPGEADEDFNDTVSFLRKLPVSYLHVFTYSVRPGTKAAEMADHVPEKVKQARSRALHKLSEAMQKAFYDENRNKTEEVLWESDVENGFMTGFTGNYIRCKKPFDKSSVNQIETVILLQPDTKGVYEIKSKDKS